MLELSMVPKALKSYQSSPSQLVSKIKARRHEDLPLINQIEATFRRHRGFVIKIPSKNTPSIILATGGLDSTISAFILLKFFHLQLYPLFIDWGQKNLKNERKIFLFFVSYFQKHFPNLYHQPQFISSHVPAPEIFNARSNIVTLRNTIFANHAISYAKYLEEEKQLQIRTVFLNTTATDSDDCPDTSLTAIRATNLNICANENDYNWQVISIAIEKELGLFLRKEDTIKIATKYHLPIHKTWTCYQGGQYQCGQCFTCWSRKASFEKAGIPDKTIYYEQTLLFKTKHTFIRLSQRIIDKLTRLLRSS